MKGKKGFQKGEQNWKNRRSYKGKDNPFSGKKHTNTTKKHLSNVRTGKHNSPNTEFKKGQSSWIKGISKEEWRKHYKNYINPMKGKHHTEEWKQQHSKDVSLENNGRWINGKSFEPYPTIFNNSLKRKIRNRDKEECRSSGIHKGKLGIHHINYDKNNCSEENLITLCQRHNSLANQNRDNWIKYYRKILNG